jgi:hypothetical protein
MAIGGIYLITAMNAASPDDFEHVVLNHLNGYLLALGCSEEELTTAIDHVTEFLLEDSAKPREEQDSPGESGQPDGDHGHLGAVPDSERDRGADEQDDGEDGEELSGTRRMNEDGSEHDLSIPTREAIERDVNAQLVHEILVALCHRDGLSIESSVEPGQPARNYDLALRLEIGEVFGLTPKERNDIPST